jgi:hypothetical protein
VSTWFQACLSTFVLNVNYLFSNFAFIKKQEEKRRLQSKERKKDPNIVVCVLDKSEKRGKKEEKKSEILCRLVSFLFIHE